MILVFWRNVLQRLNQVSASTQNILTFNQTADALTQALMG